MQFISDEYKKLNSDLHNNSRDFGSNGVRHLHDVLRMSSELKTQDILDYGCGKSTLANNMPFRIHQYDPAIVKYSRLPKPADLVICTDVLEHVEPEYIEEVLNHLKSLVKQVGFFSIGLRAAHKTLSDGRNAHLIQENERWWILKLLEKFEITYLNSNVASANFVVKLKLN